MLLGLAPREVIPAEGVGAKFSLFFQFSPRSSETQRPFPNVPQYILVGLDGSSATTWGSLPCSSSATCHFPAECSKIARASPITTKIFDISSLNLSGPRRCNEALILSGPSGPHNSLFSERRTFAASFLRCEKKGGRAGRIHGCTYEPCPRSRRIDCITWKVVLSVKTSAAASLPVYFSITGFAAVRAISSKRPLSPAHEFWLYFTK